MSKVGKKIIVLPAGVEASLEANMVSIKGPKGTLHYALLDGVQVTIQDNELSVVVPDEEKRNLW